MALLISKRLIALCLSACLITACAGGTRAVRGEDEPGLDQAAMSTKLDRRDLQKALRENMEFMQNSAVVQRWRTENRPAVAVLPMRNETSEHIDGALQALITDVETYLVNWGAVRVISMESQQALMSQIRQQLQNDGFDQSKVASWGRQIGAQYWVDGKVFSTDERVGDQRRVQYYMFIRVLAVETGEILFQNQVAITKAIVRD